MEDLTLSKDLTSLGIRKVQGTKDGQILVQIRNGLIMLATKEQPNIYPNSLSDIFTFYRLSASLNKYENFFKNVAHYGIPEMGETKTNMLTNESLCINSVSISDSGVSGNLECLFLVVTDAFNGIIFEFENGSLNPICLINKEIAEFENIDTGMIISENDMRLLRINHMMWLNGIGYKFLQNPVWPLVASSCFICFNETDTIWLYRYDCFNKKISRESSFNLYLDTLQHECILYCQQSSWKEVPKSDELSGEYSLYFIFASITSLNRMIIKKCYLDLKTNKFYFSIDEFFIEFQDAVVDYKILESDKEVTLVVVTTESIEFHNLSDENLKSVKTPLNFTVVSENFANFKDIKTSLMYHFILCNSFGELLHIKFDINKFEIINNVSYNYFDKIDSTELPLFSKINSLVANDKITIDSLTVDPTGNFIYILYFPADIKSNLIFGNSKKDALKIAIVSTQSGSKIDINDRSMYNSITTSPNYWKCMTSLQKYTSKSTSTNDEDIEMEDAQSEELSEEVSNSSILNELILNSKLDKQRINNSINGYNNGNEEFQTFKRKIQGIIATKVVNMIKDGSLKIKGELDKFMYYQYCKLIGEIIPNDAVCEMSVYGTNLVENFNLGELDIDVVLKDRQLVSVEGHTWQLCDVTLLPILSPTMRQCTHCHSVCIGKGKAERSSKNPVFATVSTATPLCVFCGGRYAQ